MSSIDAKEEFEAFFDEHDDFFGINELQMKTEDFWGDRYSKIYVRSSDETYDNKEFKTTYKGLEKASKYIRRLKTKDLYGCVEFVEKQNLVWKELSDSKKKGSIIAISNRDGEVKKLICVSGRRYINHNFWGTNDEKSSK